MTPRPRFPLPRLTGLLACLAAGFALGAPVAAQAAARTQAHAPTHSPAPLKAKKPRKKKVARKAKPVHRTMPADAPSARLATRRRAKRLRARHLAKHGMPHAARAHASHAPHHAAPTAHNAHAAHIEPAPRSTAAASLALHTPLAPKVNNAPRLLARCGFTPASQRHLFSHAVYIVDENTHTPLYARNADAVAPIASVSKLMTAIVWLDSPHAPLQRRLAVTTADLDMLKFTHSRLDVGSRVPRGNMLHIALMSSENRAAAALSRDYPGGRPAFIAAMNAKAQRLGMTHTRFVNGTGLSPHNVSTARELASLVRAANGYPLIRRYSIDHQERVSTGLGQLQYVNSNRLVRYGQVRASVQKTGFINESGHNMVMRVMVHGRRPVIVTMLGSTTPEGSRLDGVRIAHWLNCSLR